MAGLSAFGVLLLVMLTGVSYSYPIKKGWDQSGEEVNPASSSRWDAPADGFEHAGLHSSAAARPFRQAAPAEQPRFAQPQTWMGSVPALYSDTHAVPLAHGSPAVLMQPSLPLPSSQDMWAIQPPSLSGGVPSALRFISEPRPLGLSHTSPVGPGSPAFQPGEHSYTEKTYDRGNYNAEIEKHHPLPKHAPVRAVNRRPLSMGPLLGDFWFGHPYDYAILPAPALSWRLSPFVKT